MIRHVCLLAATAPHDSNQTSFIPRRALDLELHSLAADARPADSTSTLSRWMQSRFAYSGEVDTSGAPGDQDLAGFQIDSARLAWTWTPARDVSGTISVEAGDPAISDSSAPGVGLLDAYASVKLAQHVGVSIGRLSQTVLWSSSLDENRRILLDRSFLGEVLDGRDVGVELSASLGRWNAWIAVQNGSDLAGDGLGLSGRLSCSVLGAELPAREGGIAAPDGEHLTVGLAWFDDTDLDDGTLLAADSFFTSGRWGASAEWVDFGDDVRPLPVVNASTGAVVPSVAGAAGAQSAWNATVGFVLEPDAWEIAARWQDLDDTAETTLGTLGVARHAGSARWVLQYTHAHSDDMSLDGGAFAVGIFVGF